MSVAGSLTELIGNTPMLRLCAYGRAQELKADIVAKLESLNPTGSIKDRAALFMVKDAEEKGLLRPGAVMVEPTSGNTGIALASVASARGYRLVLTMPETMSAERRALLKAYGAELVLTDGKLGMQGAIDKAQELTAEIPGAFTLGQFENPANPEAHFRTTGPEIWRDTAGALDMFVAGVGTGGTLTGAGGFLKAQKPGLQVVAVEPASSPMLSVGKPGPHNLQGIGANFIPKILDKAIIDEIVSVREEDAYAAARTLSKTEGLLAGISSGAALWAATQLAAREENEGKTIVVILPDGGEKYLSTPLFAQA